MKKRLIGFLLIIVMILSIVPTAAFQTKASEDELISITKLDIYVESPIEGNLYSDSCKMPVIKVEPEGAAEIIESSLGWYYPDGSYFTGTFEAGQQYSYDMILKPKDGYKFDFTNGEYSGTIFTINGTVRYTETEGPESKWLEMAVLVDCKKENDDVTIVFDANGGTGSVPDITLTSDDVFALPSCAFTAPDGKEFGGAWEIAGWKNTYAVATTWSFYNFAKLTVIKPVWVNKDRTEITSVELTDWPAPVVGKAGAECSTLPTVTTVPEGAAEVVAGSVRWKKSDWSDVDVFEEGKDYFCEIQLRAGDDFLFDKDSDWNYTGTVVVGEPEERGYAETNAEGTILFICKKFLVKTIDVTNIEINIGQPIVGKTAEECMLLPEFTSTPADAVELYTDENAWYNRDGNGKFTGTFEEGKEYIYEFGLKTKDGYSFPSAGGTYYGTALVNGEEAYYIEIANGNNAYAYIGVVMTPVKETEDCGGDPEKCAIEKFTDAPKYTNWAHEGIEFAVKRGLFGGTSETTFSPGVSMNRAMLVTVLYRYEGSPAAGKPDFTDVMDGQWYTDAVAWAAENNIVGGVGDSKFNPMGIVTREQIATILFRYSTYKGFDTSNRADYGSFPDASKVDSWASDAMEWAIAEGYIGGSNVGGKAYLLPRDGATRAQVATILMRFVNNVEKA